MKTINKELVEEYMFRARREDQSFSIIYYSVSPQQLERFAELIVRKCGEIAFEQWCESDQMSARAEILKQFGLEE